MVTVAGACLDFGAGVFDFETALSALLPVLLRLLGPLHGSLRRSLAGFVTGALRGSLRRSLFGFVTGAFRLAASASSPDC